MNRATAMFFNLVTLVFIAATIIVFVVVISIAGDAAEPPSFLAPESDDPLPTEVVIASPTPRPSWTPSHTPTDTPTPLPTATRTPTPTATGTATLTPSVTYTPSVTVTAPPSATVTPTPSPTLPPATLTPTRTTTPVPSETPVPSLSPTGPAGQLTSPFPFIVQPDSLILRSNFINDQGCDWQGIAGLATETNGTPVVGVRVRVNGPNIEERSTLTGTASSYGPSGWAVTLGDAPMTGQYTVDLWVNEERVSPTVEIVFPGSCQQNLATVNFILTRPLE